MTDDIGRALRAGLDGLASEVTPSPALREEIGRRIRRRAVARVAAGIAALTLVVGLGALAGAGSGGGQVVQVAGPDTTRAPDTCVVADDRADPDDRARCGTTRPPTSDAGPTVTTIANESVERSTSVPATPTSPPSTVQAPCPSGSGGAGDAWCYGTTVPPSTSTTGPTSTVPAMCLLPPDMQEPGQPDLSHYDGLTVDEAEILAATEDRTVRVVCADGQNFPVTYDLRDDRVNLSLHGGVVVHAAIY